MTPPDIMAHEKIEYEGTDVHFIGKLDKALYSCVTDDIITDEVIITDERIRHIKEHHTGDYEAYKQYMAYAIESPDYIVEANRPSTALILKEFQVDDKVFKLILRLKTSDEPDDFKNSIITFMKTDKKEWARLLKNKKILYKMEDNG